MGAWLCLEDSKAIVPRIFYSPSPPGLRQLTVEPMNILKWAFAALLSISLTSCISERKVLDSWLERNIKDVIFRVGPPAQVTTDGSNGKIYVFSESSFNGITGGTYYHYIFFYTYVDGTIYHWMTKRGMVPPEQVNVDLYIHH